MSCIEILGTTLCAETKRMEINQDEKRDLILIGYYTKVGGEETSRR